LALRLEILFIIISVEVLGSSDSYVHLDLPVVSVVDHFEVLVGEFVNFSDFLVQLQLRERVGEALQLLLQGLYMVRVHMGVSQAMDQLSSLQPTHLSQHAGEKTIACNVEGYTQSHIARPLVHLAAEGAISRDIKLGKDMAGRESHLLQIIDVPGCH